MRRSFQKAAKNKILPLCRIFQQNHPVLRYPTVYTKMAFNRSIFTVIQKLKHTAVDQQSVYLTCNSAMVQQSVFVIRKNVNERRWFDSSYNSINEYVAYINPEISKIIGEAQQRWETCLSVPYIQLNVTRNQEISVKYTNQKRQKVQENLFGFKAEIFQHCMDHLKGQCILNWNKHRGNMRVVNSMEEHMPKTKFVLKEYGFRIQSILSKDPTTDLVKLSPQNQELLKSNEQRLRSSMREELFAFQQKYHNKK